MTDPSPPPGFDPIEAPPEPQRLLTITEAAAATGISRKALTRRIERGTLRSVKDSQGRRVVPRGELERAGLLGTGHVDHVPHHPVGELVIWRDLYERERQAHEQTSARVHDLELDLMALANAGPIRALRLRRRLRTQFETRVAP